MDNGLSKVQGAEITLPLFLILELNAHDHNIILHYGADSPAWV